MFEIIQNFILAKLLKNLQKKELNAQRWI